MRAMAEKPHDAVVKFDTHRNLQRHRAVLPAKARLLFSYFFKLCQLFSSSFSATLLLPFLLQTGFQFVPSLFVSWSVPTVSQFTFVIPFFFFCLYTHRYLNHLLRFSFICLNFLSYFSYSLI